MTVLLLFLLLVMDESQTKHIMAKALNVVPFADAIIAVALIWYGSCGGA